MKIIAFDIGGTGIYFGLFINDHLTTEGHLNIRGKDKAFVLKIILNKIKEIKDKHLITAIGIASPGAIINDCYINGLTGIKDYTNFDLRDFFYQEGISEKIFIINDANAAAIAEFAVRNKNSDLQHLISISIGTGLGGAIIINKKLWIGQAGLAGEFGYFLNLNNNNNLKNASQLCSALSIERSYNQDSKQKLTTKEIFLKYHDDPRAKEAITIMVERLGRLIFNIVFAFNIENIVLSGGITQNKLFLELINANLAKTLITFGTKTKLTISVSKFLNKSSLIGAYLYAKEGFEKEN